MFPSLLLDFIQAIILTRYDSWKQLIADGANVIEIMLRAHILADLSSDKILAVLQRYLDIPSASPKPG